MQTKPNTEPWSQAFVWLWYNDREIFKYTQEDFDQKAAELAERGITVALTFSLTHFRLGFYPYWKEINECIRKMVVACHKVGIRIVEHHSSHLTHNLLTELGWERFSQDIAIYGNGECSLDHWIKFYPFLTCTPTIGGKKLTDFVQIDGRTGKPATNMYGAYSMCFNNPDYRETYFNYLKDVVATGIDGIMNDDVQYFGESCTCEHCRRRFHEETGYTLPDPEHWAEFYENYDDPAYIAWKRFKFNSTERFYRDLTALYESWGLKFMRPNYSSNVLDHCPTCYTFDRCTDLWDFIFQENCFSAIIKESYMNFFTEAVHRYAAASRNGVPSMSMFYPDRADSAYFGWALARSWGQLYTGTCEGADITGYEKPYREFEKKNMRFYTAPQKLADVSFYFSQNTRDFTAKSMDRSMVPFMAQMQACYVSGLGVDMVLETDSAEELARHPRIAASHVAMASDEEVARLAEYVKNGGELILSGDFAVYRADGSRRTAQELDAAFGAALPKEGEAVRIGAGSVHRLAQVDSLAEFQPTIWSYRWVVDPEPAEATPSKWEMQRSGSGALYRALVEAPALEVACENRRVIATGFQVECGAAIHLINLADTISEKPGVAQHKDIIPNFTENGAPVPEAKVTLRKPQGFAAARAALYTPERAEATPLTVEDAGDRLTITVPGGLFSGYALIGIE